MIEPAQPQPQQWMPTKFVRHEATLTTSMDTARVMTDVGPAHIKAMGNKQGPHTLACELICTRLAHWFEVPTLDAALLVLTDADTFELNGGRHAETGPAFATRTIQASTWDGTETTLKGLCNAADLTRLVVFDTWIRNDDRYPPVDTTDNGLSAWMLNRENLLITPDGAPPKQQRFVAIDFGRGLTMGRDLSASINGISAIQDEAVYGLFPEFRSFVTSVSVDEAVKRLSQITPEEISAIIDTVPREWDVSVPVRDAATDLLYRRADYLADSIRSRLAALCFPQEGLFDGDRSE